MNSSNELPICPYCQSTDLVENAILIRCNECHESRFKPDLGETKATVHYDMTKREQILREAIKCTTKDRQATHGKPENSFADIAHLWTWYKDVTFTPQDVAVMMGLMKMARIKSNPIYDDNMVDCAGYVAIAAELGGVK